VGHPYILVLLTASHYQDLIPEYIKLHHRCSVLLDLHHNCSVSLNLLPRCSMPLHLHHCFSMLQSLHDILGLLNLHSRLEFSNLWSLHRREHLNFPRCRRKTGAAACRRAALVNMRIVCENIVIVAATQGLGPLQQIVTRAGGDQNDAPNHGIPDQRGGGRGKEVRLLIGSPAKGDECRGHSGVMSNARRGRTGAGGIERSERRVL
jgi:hypothetical protein